LGDDFPILQTSGREADEERRIAINTQMHIYINMVSKTISLEKSAYERLKSAKREGESFSDVVNRLLGDREPSLLDFHALLSSEAAEGLADTIASMRKEEMELQRKAMKG